MPLVKYVAEILGYLMNGIYLLLDKAGIPNVALAIILFTIVMYLLMTPLQISQQRFSKLNAVMSPEIQKVQAKYKGKRDQVSQQKMLDETNAIYAKYGVNQAGSCIQLLIQMPVLFALYQVIYHIPGYIGLIGGKLRVVAEDASFVSFFTKFVEKLPNNAQLTATLGTGSKLTTESVMDTIYKLNPVQWSELLKEAADKDYSSGLVSLHDYIERATNFVVMNISDTPMNLITTSFKAGQWVVLIAAVLIPLLAWGTQVLNMKLMPTANVNKDSKDSMSQTMNTMNTFMPLMSAFFCLTLPVGIGIYWIAGAVVRSIQQFIINKKLVGIDAFEKTIVQLLSAGIVMVPYLLLTNGFGGGEWNTLTVVLLLIVGLVHTGISYALYFGSTDGLKAQTIAIFSYIDPVAAMLFSAVFLHEIPGIAGIIGAIMILGSAIVSEL